MTLETLTLILSLAGSILDLNDTSSSRLGPVNQYGMESYPKAQLIVPSR